MYEISIIVPVYNMEKYLERCLNSIMNQTFNNFEILLIDDGSSDKSSIICDKYAKENNNIRVIHKKNGGISSARNCGINNANGKYLMFVDADDMIHPQVLELFHKGAEIEGAEICMGCAIEAEVCENNFFAPIEKDEYVCINDKNLKKIYNEDKHKYWVAWGKLYRKEVFAEKRFEEGKYYEDNGLIFELLYNANKILDYNQTIYFYYINSQGISKSRFSEKHLDLVWAYERQIDFYHKIQDEYMEKEIICKYLKYCADVYFKIIQFKKESKYAKEIKSKMYEGMMKWKYTHKISIEEIPSVYKILFPLKYYVYVIKTKLR